MTTAKRSPLPKWLPFADADRVKNARAAGWGLIGRGAALARLGLTELPVAERPPISKAFVTGARGGRGFIKVPPEAPLAAFAEVAGRFPVFQAEPLTDAAS